MSDKRPTIADMIAKTPGAQPRDKAIASIKARRARLLAPRRSRAPRDEEIGAPEPAPVVKDPDDYAARFWERQAAKDAANKRPPPRGKKPRLVVDNDEPPKSPKKR